VAFDYVPIKAVADTLIPSFGVPVVLSRAARAATKSWEQDQGPAASSDAQSISDGLFGVQITKDVETQAKQNLAGRGSNVAQEINSARWVLTAPTTLPEEVGPEWILTAKGTSYPVLVSTPVAPGSLLLVYFVDVKI
jgi:hypothetical protein